MKTLDQLLAENTALREELALAKALNIGLQAQLDDLMRRLYGPSSEKMDPAQLALALDGLLADAVIEEEKQPEPEPAKEPKPAVKRGGRRPLPENLPIVREVVDVPVSEREGMVMIREDVTERIDYRPSQFFRHQIVRPVYASATDKTVSPMQAAAPVAVIPGAAVGVGLIAKTVVDRFVDHLPYYRQEQMAARQGVTIERQKFCQWIEHAAVLLKIVYSQIRDKVLASGYVQADETPVRVMDPDHEGSAKKGYLWVYHAPHAREIAFEFDMSRGQGNPSRFFGSEWSGTVQSDGYNVYPAVFGERKKVLLVGCWAHARRAWVKAVDNGGERVARAMALIQKLYLVESEAKAKGLSHAERAISRAARSQKILADLNRLAMEVSGTALPESAAGKAAAYMIERWAQLEAFAQPDNGHIEIDNNPVERGIRPSALGKRNWLFIGHPEAGWRSAVMYSIMGTCKLQGVNPYDYLVWVLPRLASGTTLTVGDVTPAGFLAAVKEQRRV